MSRVLVLLAATALSLLGHGQSDTALAPLTPTDTSRYAALHRLVRPPAPPPRFTGPLPGPRLRFEARGGYDSNALLNELVMGLWRGEYLDRDLRQRTRDALTGRNRAGYEASAELDLSFGRGLFGDSTLRAVIGLSSRTVMGMRFTDAVYDLTFFGNKDYVGTTAVLAPSAQEQQRYQTLGFGVQLAGRATYARLDLVSGQYLSSVHLDKADLYTAPDGTSLTADLDGTWLSSDTGSTTGFVNGMGAALDLGLELRGTFFGRPLTTRLRVDDLGLVRWNDRALGLTKQEVVVYDGLTIDDVLDFEGSFFEEGQLRDSLALNAEEAAFTRWLPARLQAAFWYTLHRGKVKPRPGPADLTIDHLVVPGYIPRITLTRSLNLSRRWSVNGSLAYGGFGGLRLGAGAWLQLKRGALWADVPNLVGLVSPSAKGKALGIGFTYGF
ncbi:MAG: hypothetical protein JNL05_05510 [Flavobacteriales bacterium]|nr:hypothetical protein [Flavobacteriales bacterium]